MMTKTICSVHIINDGKCSGFQMVSKIYIGTRLQMPNGMSRLVRGCAGVSNKQLVLAQTAPVHNVTVDSSTLMHNSTYSCGG